MEILLAGDTALVLQFGTTIDAGLNDRVLAYQAHLESVPPTGMVELVPTYRSLMIIYDPSLTDFKRLSQHLQGLSVSSMAPLPAGQVVEIPVHYGGDYGPDLQAVAQHAGLTPSQVVSLHAAPLYRVYMIGFAPGYPYLGGLDPRLHVPRLQKPRTSIPAGSVAIGGQQTGIYPVESPGGWLVIGRTNQPLFDPNADPPTRVQAGDRVQFLAIEGSA